MNPVMPLGVSALRRSCDDSLPAFSTTDELADLDGIVGQDRAREAIEFGLGIDRDGYNLFVLGPPGAGKETLVRQLLAAKTAATPAPPDWCYVHNFQHPHQPRALSLPAGRGGALRDAMRQLIGELRAAIPAAFESDEYRAHREQVDAEFGARQEKAFAELAKHATEQDFALLRTPTGFTLAPVRNGEVIGPDEFAALGEDDRRRIAETMSTLQQQLEQLMVNGLRWRREQRERVRALNRDVAQYAVGSLMEDLKQHYAMLPAVTAHLAAVEHSLVENFEDFRRGADAQPTVAVGVPATPESSFRRYEINLLLDRRDPDGVPVVFEDHPTYQNLVGRVEHTPELGALITDHTLIKAGALHRANGGYLLLDAQKVVAQPFAWDALKRVLSTHTIRIESLGQMVSLVSTTSLEPEPIPVDVKLVLFGERDWYQLLFGLDPDFRELFKVAADFDDQVPRSPENHAALARLIATIARRKALLPFGRDAVARLIDERAREVADRERLSTHMQNLVDLMTEADFAARSAAAATIGDPHVDAAIAAQRRRAGRVREQVQEAILRGTVLIDTDGEAVGQVNGLSVYALGGQVFAKPTRITAHARIGDGEVIDVQREVALGGPIHSKGVLILAGFLAARFSTETPHSLRASLVFEQTYGEVEGDSASAAELCALLSALARAPIRQAIAVTGSVNQRGELQSIGAVNEKIEGYFDICAARGLDGGHAVLIPHDNVKNLMLRADVVAAVGAGRFRIYAVATIDEAIELLTGIAAGEAILPGHFPDGTINQRVAARLTAFSRARQVFAGVAAPAGWRPRPRRKRE